MPVDVRCAVVSSLGQVIDGQVGDDLITEPGLIRTTGSMVINTLTLPRRGAKLNLAYYQPQKGTISNFPRPLRVLRATANPYKGITTLEVGCKVALRYDVAKPDRFPQVDPDTTGLVTNADFEQTGTGSVIDSYIETYPPIAAQDVLEYCLAQVGIDLAAGSYTLQFQYLRPYIDLSNGYLSVVNDLIKSESCFGSVNLAEELLIQKIDLTAGGTAAVLADDDLIDLQPVTGGQEPADEVTVSYSLFGR